MPKETQPITINLCLSANRPPQVEAFELVIRTFQIVQPPGIQLSTPVTPKQEAPPGYQLSFDPRLGDVPNRVEDILNEARLAAARNAGNLPTEAADDTFDAVHQLATETREIFAKSTFWQRLRRKIKL